MTASQATVLAMWVFVRNVSFSSVQDLPSLGDPCVGFGLESRGGASDLARLAQLALARSLAAGALRIRERRAETTRPSCDECRVVIQQWGAEGVNGGPIFVIESREQRFA